MSKPIIVDTLDDVKKIIPEDEILEYDVWAPEKCEYEWGCTDKEENYICHDLNGVMACRKYYGDFWETYYPEYHRVPPWELIRGVEGYERPVPFKKLMCSCSSGTEAELTIPVRVEKDYEDSETVYLPLCIEYRRSMLSVYIYMTKLKKMYSSSIVRAIKDALESVWYSTVKVVFYELVDYDLFDAARAISVIEWRPGTKTKYIIVPCHRGAIVVEVPLQAIVDTVRRYLRPIL